MRVHLNRTGTLCIKSIIYNCHNSETILTEWTKDYARKLQETREKGGLLSHPPSSNLLEAEHKLAEVI